MQTISLNVYNPCDNIILISCIAVAGLRLGMGHLVITIES